MSNKAILKLRLYFLLRPKKSQNKIFLFSQTVFDYFLDLVDLVGQGLLPHVLGQVLLDQLLHLDGVRLLTNISRPLVEQLASTPFLRSKERNQINTSYQKLLVNSKLKIGIYSSGYCVVSSKMQELKYTIVEGSNILKFYTLQPLKQ